MAENKKPAQDSDKGLLSRWSERKLQSEPATTPAKEQQAPAVTPQSQTEAPRDDDTIDPEDLPDIDSLDENSDFTVFLKDGVPDEIRNLALRKLWRSNPLLANLDGLNDYDDDYSKIGTVVQEILTGVNEAKKKMAGEKPSSKEKTTPQADDQEAPDKPEKAAGADEVPGAGDEEEPFDDDGDLEA